MKGVFPFLNRSNVVILVLLICLIPEWAAQKVGPNNGNKNKYVRKDSTVTASSPHKDLSCPEDGQKGCDKDLMGMESIRMLHRMLDDDHNGNVDQSESDEFLRDELQYTDGFERQALFHNNDKLISVDDLWKAWKNSVVYNWTVDDVIEWLIQDVDLPQYSHVFHSNEIDGSFLPRLVNSTGTLLSALGIRNPVHKQKLSLKAMDTVLFGAPKRIHSYVKDLLLMTSLIIAIGGCWFAYLHHRYSQTQVRKMMKDLESLQKAEEALKKLSNELTEAEKNQKSVPPEKQEEMRMLRKSSIRLKLPHHSSAGGEISPVLSRDGSVVRRQEGEKRLKQAEEELMNLRTALSEAESKLEFQQQMDSQWSTPGELQAWLQLTYELEQLHYSAKHQAAERQLMAAKEGCDKIKKRNKAFLGSLRLAHSNSLDDIDQSILNARGALEEVKQDLEERRHRWHTMELLCGFAIIETSPGLPTLKLTLGRDPGNTASRAPGSVLAPISIDEADEDIPPSVYMIQSGMHTANSPNYLSPEEGPGFDASIYNKITDRQRQQIFAWARRSRLSRRKVSNGYPTMPASAASKTFLKQQTLAGSNNSLSHAGKTPSSAGLPVLLKRESRENELHHSSHLSVANSVAFHLGEGSNSHHERSHSNISSNQRGVTSTNTLTNGHHHPHHYQPHSKLNSPSYTHSSAYPNNSKLNSPSSTNTLNSHTASYGNISHKNGLSQTGSYSNFRGSVPSNSTSVSANGQHHQQQRPSGQRLSSPEDHHQLPTHRPETLNLNQSLDGTGDLELPDSPDYGDTGSNAGSSPRPHLDKTPEFDTNSMETESLHSASLLEVKMQPHSPKKSRLKKKLLPPFLRKNSSKHKN